MYKVKYSRKQGAMPQFLRSRVGGGWGDVKYANISTALFTADDLRKRGYFHVSVVGPLA